MHGRLKVKTTAQQEAEKKKHRQEKLETYENAMKAILDTRKFLEAGNSPNVRFPLYVSWYHFRTVMNQLNTYIRGVDDSNIEEIF